MRRKLDMISALDPLTLLRESHLAGRWDKSLRTLQRWRAEGCGPPYILIGGSPRYRVADVLAFEERQRRGGKPERARIRTDDHPETPALPDRDILRARRGDEDETP